MLYGFEVDYRVPLGLRGKEIIRKITRIQTGMDPLFADEPGTYNKTGCPVVITASKEISGTFYTIAYPPMLMPRDSANLVNLIFGEVTLTGPCRIVGLRLPAEWGLKPKMGITGLRQECSVHHRPLLMAILKPAWKLTIHDRVKLVRILAASGVDIIKDDEITMDSNPAKALERVQAVLDAVREAGYKRGRNLVYVAALSGNGESLVETAKHYGEMGIQSVLICLIPAGFSVLDDLARTSGKYPAVFVHPSGTGALYMSRNHGIQIDCLLGSIMSQCGVDAVLYPSSFGEYPIKRKFDREILRKLRDRNVFPVPGGGLTPERIRKAIKFYGKDWIVNAGSYVMHHPSGPGAAIQTLMALLETHVNPGP